MDIKKDEINIGIKIFLNTQIHIFHKFIYYLFEIRLHSVSGIDVSETSSSSSTKLYLSCML